ncbi:DUF5050 domain-containing protein, partial [Acidobacteria bacterium AH-259-O06]|nr:DUF5050 domain-containing protein [Acidobacteria bacterium AH-259-O06]
TERRPQPEAASAMPTAQASEELLTSPGTAVGTVAYMSPEQARGEEPDTRTDLFSFGVVLYEMATGSLPFKGTATAVVFSEILTKTPTSPVRLNPELPDELEKITDKALEKDREVRYQSAKDLMVDLKRLKRDTDSGKSAITAPAKVQPAVPLRLVGTIVVAIVIIAAGWFWFVRPPRQEAEAPLSAVPLTSYAGQESGPSFSPDGNQVAFSWDGQKQDNFDIYVQQIGVGRPLRLTTDPAADSRPAWSPDGRHIAFLRGVAPGKAEVRLIPPLGGSERKLAEIGSSSSTLAWSPDSEWLAVTDRPTTEEPLALFLLSTGSGEKRRLTSPQVGRSDGHPAFSRDGRTLAFSRVVTFGLSHLYLLELSEEYEPIGEPRQLTYESGLSRFPVWIQDGREIIFSLGSFTNPSLYRISVSGSARPRRLSFGGENGWHPAISQQGHGLAYAQSTYDTNIWRAAVPRPSISPSADTSEPEKLIFSTREDRAESYAPDGARIAFRSDRSGSPEIWVCNSDGSNPVKLTSFGGPTTGSPSWSPDGQQICFVCRPEQGNADICVISSEGGAPRRVTSNPSAENWPSWSRDGEWIYFRSNRSGENQVWKIRPEGGEAVQVTRGGGTRAIESPEGKTLYYSKSTQGGQSLWRVSVEGGEERKVLDGLLYNTGFDVVNEGIYFISGPDASSNQSIAFLEFASGKITPIPSVSNAFGRISVSPDGRWILYDRWEETQSDLMLVENFR